jgi:type IV fimbrial biogenesis protein FimT
MITRKSQGFSLLELLVVLTISAVLLNLAAPSLSSFVDNQERKSAMYGLMSAFALARQQAVMTGAIVTICPLDETNACGKDWNSEIHVFLDPYNTRELKSSKALIRTISPEGKGRLTVRSLSRSFFQFKPTGLVLSDLGNVTWCPKDGNQSLAGQIIISRGGRTRFARDNDNDGIAEDAQGRPLRC